MSNIDLTPNANGSLPQTYETDVLVVRNQFYYQGVLEGINGNTGPTGPNGLIGPTGPQQITTYAQSANLTATSNLPTTQNVISGITGAYTNNFNSANFSISNNIMTYTGATGVFLCLASISFTDSANTMIVNFYIQKNGSAGTTVAFGQIYAGSPTTYNSISINGMVTLNPNDTIQLMVKNITNSDTLLSNGVSLSVIQI